MQQTLMNSNDHDKLACQNCAAASLCLPAGLSAAELVGFNQLIDHYHTLKRGEHLVQTGDPFTSFFAIKSGACKSYTLNSEGREQIWGFYFVGELFGFEGIAEKQFPYSISALSDVIICEIPYQKLMEYATKTPSLHQQLLALISQRCIVDLNIPRNNSAEKRIASFLLSLSTRFRQRGFTATQFQLPLSRQEIANYLGLTLETVSRLIGKLKQSQIISITGKMVTIHNLRELQTIAAI